MVVGMQAPTARTSERSRVGYGYSRARFLYGETTGARGLVVSGVASCTIGSAWLGRRGEFNGGMDWRKFVMHAREISMFVCDLVMDGLLSATPF